MKFNDILMAIDNNTMIRVTMEMYGMKFSTNHYAEYFLDCDEAGELLDKRGKRQWTKLLKKLS